YVLAGYFAVAIVFCAWYARRMINLSSQLVDASRNVDLTGPRALARVGKLQEAGHVVSSFNHEFIFTLTVFPQSAAPYETTIRQFITMGELPNFYTGRFVVFVEDSHNPGYGLIEKEPPEDWQLKALEPPQEWKTQKASTSYPDQ